MDYLLPEEIKLDIFSRLPAESVLQCRRVRKTWRTLLNIPSFPDMHLHRQLLNLNNPKYRNHSDALAAAAAAASSSRVSFIHLIESEKEMGPVLYYGEYDENDEQSFTTVKRINHPSFGCPLSIAGSCNGLICLSLSGTTGFDSYPVYIFNPITRECINLPTFIQEPSRGEIVCGFGYTLSTNEYKVVIIYYPKDIYVGQVKVYTLGTGSGWRNEGEITHEFNWISTRKPGVYANEALYWMDSEGKVVAFDLKEEKFRLLQSPPCLQSDSDIYLSRLRVLEGCLCFVHCNKHESVDIWTLKKNSSCDDDIKDEGYHESWSWSKDFSIPWKGIFLDEFHPFPLSKSCEVLFIRGIVFRYDPKTATLEKLVDHYPGYGGFFQAITHINSFVSLKAL